MWVKGQSGNPAGSKPGVGGRKPDWFIKRCQELFENEELLEFVAMVAKGGKFAQLHPAGVIDAPPTIKNRLEAVQMLKEWGFGKETQPIAWDDENPLAPIPTQDLRDIFAAFAGGTSGSSEGRA